mmetsp:Transcript_9218/g.26570  ORF Transcript_9218/g.26570 Transcript_9218/m.26570 type:complete len:470 (-) Transcript_9218:547-1956(-)
MTGLEGYAFQQAQYLAAMGYAFGTEAMAGWGYDEAAIQQYLAAGMQIPGAEFMQLYAAQQAIAGDREASQPQKKRQTRKRPGDSSNSRRILPRPDDGDGLSALTSRRILRDEELNQFAKSLLDEQREIDRRRLEQMPPPQRKRKPKKREDGEGEEGGGGPLRPKSRMRRGVLGLHWHPRGYYHVWVGTIHPAQMGSQEVTQMLQQARKEGNNVWRQSGSYQIMRPVRPSEFTEDGVRQAFKEAIRVRDQQRRMQWDDWEDSTEIAQGVSVAGGGGGVGVGVRGGLDGEGTVDVEVSENAEPRPIVGRAEKPRKTPKPKPKPKAKVQPKEERKKGRRTRRTTDHPLMAADEVIEQGYSETGAAAVNAHRFICHGGSGGYDGYSLDPSGAVNGEGGEHMHPGPWALSMLPEVLRNAQSAMTAQQLSQAAMEAQHQHHHHHHPYQQQQEQHTAGGGEHQHQHQQPEAQQEQD